MNNEKKSALNSTYKQFLNAGFKSEGLSLLQKFVVKDVAGYGSTEDEKIQGIAGLKALLRNQKKQAKGMKFTWKTTPFSRYLTADENTAVYADDVYLSIKAGKELIKMYLRFSTVLNYINDQWKVIHWHGSKPEQVQSDADTYGIDNLKQKNAELEKLVQEKTADLTQKNRELEIEAALERVRSRAMAMHTSNELKEVAREMRHQLCLLGQKELETCAIHLWDESSGEFEGWAALRSPDNTGQLIESESRFTFKGIRILEESFQNYQAGKKDYVLINDVAKAKEFFKALKPVDPTAYAFLSPTIKHKKPEDISAYWSVSDFDGGSLVMVTRNLPNENSRALLRRFADVFGLAYRRFSDLKKAEAQAREAQIEAALERVRSRSMAMHKSEELKQVIRVVLDQFVHLKINVGHAGFYIDYKAHDDMHIWLADPNIEPFFAVLPYFDTPTWNSFLEAKAKGITLHTDLLDFKTKNKFYKSLFKLFEIQEEAKEFYLQCKGLAVSTVLLDSVGLYIENFDGTPYTNEENNILLRFGKVFQQAYTRFLDLQNAEAQAREAQIEASLERVRAKAMAMHKSDELLEVINVISEQLQQLEIRFGFVCFGIVLSHGDLDFWMASPGFEHPEKIRMPYVNNPITTSLLEAHSKGTRFMADFFPRELMLEWQNVLFENNPDSRIMLQSRKYILESPGLVRTTVLLKDINVFAGKFGNKPFTNEQNEIIARFANVFEQTYTRFLDLQKAEAQAREAQIEAALERVRSRSMAMHKSDELKQVIRVVLDQFVHLKINVGHAGFYIDYKAHDDMHIWLADPNIEPFFAVLPYFDTPTWNSFLEAKAKGITLHTDLLDFKTKNKFYKSLFKLFAIPEEAKEFYLQCKGLAVSTVLLESVGLYIENFDGIPYTDEENNILLRFGKVFQQAYTRFLDLQKAESQAREAQVEAALERVRARTMAMQKSSELNPTADLLFDQLKLLGADLQGVAFAICDKDSDIVQKWTSIGVFSFPYTIEPAERNMYEAWKNKVPLYEEIFEGERIKKYYETLMEVPAFKQGLQKLIDAGVPMPTWQKNHAVAFQQGYLLIITTKPFSETQIFVRFGKVFEQTYTRFLDLQKAEAQSRESQIQLALERVRASTMAMQKSEDLKKIVKVVLRQFRELGFVMEGGAVHIGILNDDSKIYTQWSAEPLLETVDSYNVPYNDNPLFADVLKAKKRGEEFFFQKYSFEEKNKWFDWAFVHSDFKRLPDEFKKVLKECNSYAHWTAFQKNSLITINNVLDKSLSHEQIAILKRFSEVFEQAYTRFLDLQKAEVNAKEAVKQAALDRIRADIAAMRTVSDLERITPLIWNELTILGIPFIRCGVFIMDEEKELIHTFLSTPDGKAIAAVHIPYNTPGKIKQIPQNWRKKLQYTDHWNDPDFTDFADALVQQHAIASADQYLSGVPHGGFYLHFVPFLQGMMYAGNSTKLDDAEINIIQSVADAFSTAYARYEDFNKLEAAKRQVDNALNELQATQKQLIQSEKMASLGELTAGIAHEIQNPLNFVNNFSEVNKEMIDEVTEEINKGNYNEAKNILNDVKENSKKINHHGQRAADIVKGMLQHSRTSSGQKELTDINALCDEYLRLAYHGLRAKDKTFNAKFETDFDVSIPKINIVPQDMGRVILNLINNAFYAVNDKAKQGIADYEPTVWVSTKKENGKVLISVTDNGNGIPATIKDKIFQPFFTTKPTGKGTGLGLSLSYDIVKAHGGEIKLESQPASREGTTFIIALPNEL